MVLVGSSSGTESDVWASFNGGAQWTRCQLQAGADGDGELTGGAADGQRAPRSGQRIPEE